MARKKKPSPLNVLVGLAGVAFGLTACAYGLFMVLELRNPGISQGAQSGFLGIMNQYGAWLLGGELVVLAISSVAAMALDGRQQQQVDRPARSPAAASEDEPQNSTA